ncbi:unnamed protein product [Fraxinus pennsylvanica]|uniref:GAGA-binding transcriptional activator n=1 Tax=Fraxinus pennsylvanica TaxID=56036 RepID=A0AAD2A8J3_9LAMI|nr:unnamed protein product [Fraxinus pennsylvanica]
MDATIQERNLALSQKKVALAKQDVAILQRDSAIVERDNAIMERDNAIATLQYRENEMNRAPKPTKSCSTKCTNKAKAITSTRKTTKSSKKMKQESEGTDKTLFRNSQGKSGLDIGIYELNRQLREEKPDWKDQDLGLNHVAFDEQ